MSKFHNKKTEAHGRIFDSKMEADYYKHLLSLQEKEVVDAIVCQPVYLLQPSFTKLGRTIRKMEYKADFYVTYTDGHCEVIDIKGFATSDFKLKAKLFDYYYPDLELKIITKHKGAWILLKDKPKKGRA